MNRHYIFASHGNFAAGILHSVELILGEQPRVRTLCAYINEQDDLSAQVDELLQSYSEQDELIVLTDIFAGSVNNEFMRFIHRPHFHLIAGLNLPLIIDMFISESDEATERLISHALENARESIQYCNHTIGQQPIADKDF